MQSYALIFDKAGWKLLVILLGAVVLTPAAPAQYSQPKQQPAAQSAQQPAQPAPKAGQDQLKPGEAPPSDAPPLNKEEEAASRAFFALKSQENPVVITSGEEFLAKYPDSRYRDSVYARLVHAYVNANQDAKVMAVGKQALAVNPDNVDVLALMSWYMGHHFDSNALDAEQVLKSRENYGRHALELMIKMEKPAALSEEDFAKAKADKQALAHSGLALVYYHENKTPQMVAELEQAIALDPIPDPLNYFLLGDGDARMKKFADAAAAYDHCAQMTWAWQAKCQAKMSVAKNLAATQPAPPASAPAQPAVAAPPSAVPAPPAPTRDPMKPPTPPTPPRD